MFTLHKFLIMEYIEYHLVSEHEEQSEILMAFLSELPFETFDIQSKNLYAYIATHNHTEAVASSIKNLQNQFLFSFEAKQYENKNWNEEWESNFKPVYVADKVFIRAAFHEPMPNAEYEIMIEPKMSFGTGHHESTYLMIELMILQSFKNKKVCDAGSGTGILTIFALKKGASHVIAIDNNAWAYQNCKDNAILNSISSGLEIVHAELEYLEGKRFDCILANINKPVLMQYLPLFQSCVEENGVLLLSGVLRQDMTDVLAIASHTGFKIDEIKERGDWAAAKLSI